MNFIKSSVIFEKNNIFENEKMKDLSRKILHLENLFRTKYGSKVFNDYLTIAELITEELILGTEIAFYSGANKTKL